MFKRRLLYLVWLLVIALLYFFENNTGTRTVLVASILLPFLSILSAFHSRKLNLELKTPHSLPVNQDSTCSWRLHGHLPLASSVTIHLVIQNPLIGRTEEQTFLLSKQQSAFSIFSACCGTLHMSLSECFSSDWLGLFRFPLSVTSPRLLPVRPELYDVHLFQNGYLLGSDNSSGIAMLKKMDSAENDIRPYIPGDSIRQIHWKLSEKADETLVREMISEEQPPIFLLLETGAISASPAAIHMTVTSLLSTAHALLQADLPFLAVWFDNDSHSPECMSVSSFQEFQFFRDVLLSLKKHEEGSIAELFSDLFPDIQSAQILLFSPHVEVEISDLQSKGLLTLILPFEPTDPQNSEISEDGEYQISSPLHIVSLNPQASVLDLA